MTTGTESLFNGETAWISTAEGKTCRQKPDVAFSIFSCEEDEEGQSPQPSGFHLSLGRVTTLSSAGAACCTDAVQKPDTYLLRSPFQKGNC